MKKGKIRIKILTKASARTQHAITALNVIVKLHWLMELSDNKLSNNKLSNNKLSERTKTNHDQLPREYSSLTITRQITLHIICINFQVVFFENNFREHGTLDPLCEEIIKPHIFIESRQEYV